MVTFTRVAPQHVLLHGLPTTDWSWFEGYSWQIAVCARCYAHLGWRYVWAGPPEALQPSTQGAAAQQGGQQQQGPDQQQQQQPLNTDGRSSGSHGGDGGAAQQGHEQRRRHTFWGLRRPALLLTDGEGLQIGLSRGADLEE